VRRSEDAEFEISGHEADHNRITFEEAKALLETISRPQCTQRSHPELSRSETHIRDKRIVPPSVVATDQTFAVLHVERRLLGDHPGQLETAHWEIPRAGDAPRPTRGIDPLELLRAVAGVSQGGAGDGWVANAKKVAVILVAGIRARLWPAKGKAGQ
jgi:hypothetical protein